jgi:hypothetical protein
MNEGKGVGSSFLQGFKEGFDIEQITEALKTWAKTTRKS